MADDDNFDIDIYGDGEGEGIEEENKVAIVEEGENDQVQEQGHHVTSTESASTLPVSSGSKESSQPRSASATVSSADTKPTAAPSAPKTTTPVQQGTKRKGESDERRIDAGATNALMISDLHWWTTEDDIRGWANDAGAEDELRDVTFSEHKVNGKSKGQAFVEFSTPQASTALKHMIEHLSSNGTAGANSARKFNVAFTSAATNPFKTLPKDAPARAKDDRNQRAGSTPYSAPPQNDSGGYRGNGFRGRGGFNSRGGYQNQNQNQNQNGYNNNNNRNYSGPMNSGNGGFNNQNFQQNMPMMNNFGAGFNNRGAMMSGGMRGGMGLRGGRGGGNTNMMGNPAAMMPMGMNMAMMGMNPMVAGMGPQGFAANTQFNPAMFGQGGAQGMNMNVGDWGHGPKRQRQD